MPTVASGIICAWPSTAASIPSGWTRETQMDAKYIQGAPTSGDADLTTARGASTHTHTSPSHTPIQNSHTHVITFAASSGVVKASAVSEVIAIDGHTHSGTSASATATNNGVAITVNANSSNDLAFKSVIFIKSDGTPTGVPVNAYAFFASDTLPTGWTRVQGNTYLKGAAAAGDGGGTGGSLTHTHTSPAHTHTQNSHTHGTATSGANSGGGVTLDNSFGGSLAADQTHTHDFSLNAATATNNSVTTTIDSANHEPVFKKLNIVNNGSASADLPTGVICLWGGTHAGIPADWIRFTAMDGNFVKGANADGESNVTTGGATTHTHTASSCQPVQGIHSHTVTYSDPSVLVDVNDFAMPADPVGASDTHTHSTSGGTRASNQSTAVTIDANTAESAYPPYVRAIFVEYTPAVVSALPQRTLLGVGL